ncbi:MAG: CRISPR-associated endonuclease Cas1, partial [Verrucomicrobiota bacterium]
AMLSLTYMLTLGHAVGACHEAGLDPAIGFLHEPAWSRPGLALDLLEPFRASVCDRFVMQALQREKVRPDDFTTDPENGCRFRPDAFRRFIQDFARRHAEDEQPGQSLRMTLRHAARAVARSIRDRTVELDFEEAA